MDNVLSFREQIVDSCGTSGKSGGGDALEGEMLCVEDLDAPGRHATALVFPVFDWTRPADGDHIGLHGLRARDCDG